MKPIRMVLLNYKKNGEPFWNLLSLSPTVDENDRLLFICGIQMDVSEALTRRSRPTPGAAIE